MTAPLEPTGSPAFPDSTADPAAGPRLAAGGASERTETGPPPSARDIRPTVAWYWIGAVILVGSVLGSFVLLVTGIISVINAPQAYPRVSVPGERTVTLTDAGTYFLFGESDEWSGYNGYGFGTYLNPPDVRVTDGSGAPVTLTSLTRRSSSDYSANGFRGYPFASFVVPSGGSYTITTSQPVVRDTPTGPGGTGSSGTTPTTRRSTSSYPTATFDAARVAVGRDAGASNTARFGAAIALGAVGFVLGVVLLSVTAIRRNRSRAALFPKPVAAPVSPYGRPYAGPAGAGPYAAGPYAAGPHGSGPAGAGPYGSGPYGSGPYGSGPYGSGPYGSGPYGSGPYSSGQAGAGPYGSGPAGTGPSGASASGTGPSGAPPYGPGASAAAPAGSRPPGTIDRGAVPADPTGGSGAASPHDPDAGPATPSPRGPDDGGGGMEAPS